MPPEPVDPLDQVLRLSADLQRRGDELTAVFDVLPIGIGIASDPACTRIRMNRAFAAQLGIDVTQNASMSAPDGERPAFKIMKEGRVLAADELPMQMAARLGIEVREFEVDIVQPDGRRISLYEYAAPLFDDAGSIRGAIGVFIDITERRRVEQEQRFLAEASVVLSSTLDYAGTLQALTRLAVPLFGDYCAIDVQADNGAFERVEFVVNDPARQEVAQALKRYPPRLALDSPAMQAIRTGEPLVGHEVPIEVMERAAQSPEHLQQMRRLGPTSYMMVPLRARGRTLGLLTAGSITGRKYTDRDVSLALDIAGRAALALDNALLYQHAQEANRLKEEFLATLSHELRTPLNALLGWTHLLKGSLLDDASRRRALDSIERNAHAQAVLINDLLDVSRVISGKLRLDEKPLDLAAVVMAAVDAVRPAVRARDIELNISVAPVTSDVIGDADRLQQVVWNLLSNAVKFTPSGGRIDVSVEEPVGAVQIVVADSGAGIDPLFLPYVFERFRQGDSSTTRTQSGLGLGLAIVRHLVDLHGGTVTAESQGPGTGSRFTVTLPARGARAAETTPTGTRTAGTTKLGGVRVLAVDDDEDSRELILMTVRASGADVMVVSSSASALDALASFKPDVLIADIAMPGGDGFELVREIRTSRAPSLPVIALSAYASAADERRALEAGFTRHLGKPADFDTLVSTIAGVVQRIRT
jgi:signal transduction histidine kinase